VAAVGTAKCNNLSTRCSDTFRPAITVVSHCFRTQRSPFGLAGGYRLCSLCGTNWMCLERTDVL
jgi:hypothetical protein